MRERRDTIFALAIIAEVGASIAWVPMSISPMAIVVLGLAIIAVAYLFAELLDLWLVHRSVRRRQRRRQEPRLIAGYRIGAPRHGRSH